MINADKPLRWKQDIAASVDMFNAWFMTAAPQAYREQRAMTVVAVKEALELLDDMRRLNSATLEAHPKILATLRMSTAPPIARDRLSGLAHLPRSLVKTMEADGRIPKGRGASHLDENLTSICKVVGNLLDEDVFPWLADGTEPSELARTRASTIVADRLTGSLSDPIVRNAQEQR